MKVHNIIQRVVALLVIVAFPALSFAIGALHITTKQGEELHFAIDSVAYSKTDANGVEHANYVMQHLYRDGRIIYSIAMDDIAETATYKEGVYVSSDIKELGLLKDCNNYLGMQWIPIINQEHQELKVTYTGDKIFENECWTEWWNWTGPDISALKFAWVEGNDTGKERIGELTVSLHNGETVCKLPVRQVAVSITDVLYDDDILHSAYDCDQAIYLVSGQGDTIHIHQQPGHECDIIKKVNSDETGIGGRYHWEYLFDQWSYFKNPKEDVKIIDDGNGNYAICVRPNPDNAFRFIEYDIDVLIDGCIPRSLDMHITQVPNCYPTYDEIKTALMALYNAVDDESKQKLQNYNWNNPLWQWTGIENSGPYPTRFSFPDGLRGTIPSEMSYLISMRVVLGFGAGINAFGYHNFEGDIPEACINHPNWNAWNGWNWARQGAGFGIPGRRDMDVSKLNLHFENVSVTPLDNARKLKSHDIFSKNEVTIVYSYEASGWDGKSIKIERLNRHLAYRNKGLGTVICISGQASEEETDLWRKYAKELGYDEIIWTRGFGDVDKNEQPARNLDFNTGGQYYMFDKHGNVLTTDTQAWWTSEDRSLDSILLARLGEPEDDKPQVYESTDYSRDGEVVQLQQATVGSGIDIIFMGDAYVDRDMEEGGVYEQDMRQGMEQIFSAEPYKSLRDRFNVYMVKVVSKHEYGKGGHENRINQSNEVCLEYAAKIPGIDLNSATICASIKEDVKSAVEFAYCHMYEECTGSITHVVQGGMGTTTVTHEVGGHGIGKLGDEYLDSSAKGQSMDESGRTYLDHMHSIDWFTNIAYVSDPMKVAWAHFLNDDRYKDEVGMYEGAYMWEYGVWRPSEKGIMNASDLDAPYFNVPSREAIYKRIMQLSEGDGWQYSYEDFVAWDKAHPSTYDAPVKIPTKSHSARKPKRIHRAPEIHKGAFKTN